jgi:hypothetical protein
MLVWCTIKMGLKETRWEEMDWMNLASCEIHSIYGPAGDC